MSQDSMPKTSTGTGQSLNIPVPQRPQSPADGDQGFAKQSTSIPIPSQSDVKTQTFGAPAPNLSGAKSLPHGGTVDTSPKPFKVGMEGVPKEDRSIPNK